MKLSLNFRNELYGQWPTAQGYLVENFDYIISQITSGYGKQHNADDTHGVVTATSISSKTVLASNFAVSGTMDMSGQYFINTKSHLKVSLTGSINDYNPTGFTSLCYVLDLDSNGAYDFTGLKNPAVSPYVRVVYLVNHSAFTITLKQESGSSIAENRFALPGAADLAIRANGGATLIYLPANNRWYTLTP